MADGILKKVTEYESDPLLNVRKQEALQYILDAWDEALSDGVDPYLLANAAIFAALTDMVQTHGEDAVSMMTDKLAQRIHQGEFTLNRVIQ